MAEDSTEHLVAATLANGIMAAKGGTPTPIEAVALRVLRCPQAGVAFALFSNNVSAGCQAGETMKSKDRKRFSHRIDMWDDDGENVLEHLAGVEDFVHDFKGKQLRDLKQAREHALIIARDVMTTKSTLLREPISEWSVTVKDGKFQKLFSVPIMGAMSQSDETTEPSGHPPT